VGGGGHTHGGHGHPANERRTLAAALVTGGFMAVEAVGGWLSGSLALLADAGHMLTDTASLFFAWYAFRLSRRPATSTQTYGLDRIQVLVAFGNGLAMLFVVASIAWQAVQRIWSPTPIAGPLMLTVAVLGLLVNVFSLAILMGGDRSNLNIRGAVLHVAGDVMGSVAAILAGIIVVSTGYTTADPILSLVVCGLLLRASVGLVRDSGRILLEAAPHDLDADEIRAALQAEPGVLAILDLHIWCLTRERLMMTLHVEIPGDTEPEPLADRLKALLRTQFGVDHTTIELRRVSASPRAAG